MAIKVGSRVMVLRKDREYGGMVGEVDNASFDAAQVDFGHSAALLTKRLLLEAPFPKEKVHHG